MLDSVPELARISILPGIVSKTAFDYGDPADLVVV